MSQVKIMKTPTFERLLSKLSPEVQERILSEIASVLSENPEAGKLLKGSYTVKFADTTLRIKLRSFRVGDYRVIYWYDRFKNTVWLLIVGHRKWVYKLLKRL